MDPTTDVAQLVAAIQLRIVNGETVPREELRAALDAARRSREAEAYKVKAKKQPTRSAEDLLSMLDTPVKAD